jgi:hypothetical protein
VICSTLFSSLGKAKHVIVFFHFHTFYEECKAKRRLGSRILVLSIIRYLEPFSRRIHIFKQSGIFRKYQHFIFLIHLQSEQNKNQGVTIQHPGRLAQPSSIARS